MTNPSLYSKFQIDQPVDLKPSNRWPKRAIHYFDEKQVTAILAAKEICRPLLIRGEPGCGKTQMARAAAQVLGMPLAMLVVNERTEAEDLFWHYDALKRLSDANRQDGDGALDEEKYLSAGPLWWALNHQSAQFNEGRRSAKPELHTEGETPSSFDNGVLLLIDEIDKADRAVPNSLLEALGQYSFNVPFTGETVKCESDKPPLIIITSNGEQALPPAFVRRCLVLNLELPDKKESEFTFWLTKRAGGLFQESLATSTLEAVAKTLHEKRNHGSKNRYRPGLAEYLDHLEAIIAMKKHRPLLSEEDAINELGKLVYEKDRDV